ncbi:hypothetical protein PybrP1_003579 [[Pythium] brassicae (nom. inval.)]|nr:hypothetical protein PybrP1_003579 [[Pythium] brassicae (nom. inval.)]
MMDMQEIKARKPHAGAPNNAPSVAAAAEEKEEIDPSVPSAPLLDEHARRRRHDKNVGSWVQTILDRVWSAAFLAVAGFGLHEAQFVHELLYAREARRAWVHAGIGCASLVVLFGSYIELYRSMLLREKVSYETARTSTHGMLASMVAAGVCFSVGLWPVWHWLTLPYLFMCFWGVIVQIVVIFPVQAQRVIFACGYLWFMHAYLSLFIV